MSLFCSTIPGFYIHSWFLHLIEGRTRMPHTFTSGFYIFVFFSTRGIDFLLLLFFLWFSVRIPKISLLILPQNPDQNFTYPLFFAAYPKKDSETKYQNACMYGHIWCFFLIKIMRKKNWNVGCVQVEMGVYVQVVCWVCTVGELR